MMMPMQGGPIDRPAMERRGGERREHELHGPRRSERPVPKVAVIEPSQREHADSVEHDGHGHGDRTGADDKDEETGGMERGEHHDPRPVNPLHIADRAERGAITGL
jgi:hypothetical protein